MLYRVAPAVLLLLDRYDPRYERITVQVLHEPDDQAMVAITYISDYLLESPRITPAYRDYLLLGARERGLSPDYIAMLAQIPIQHDTREWAQCTTQVGYVASPLQE